MTETLNQAILGGAPAPLWDVGRRLVKVLLDMIFLG
jgi:hypothetical protein